MLTRPALAIYTAVCLLAGFLAVPSGPILVCRMSGKPMMPVLASSPEASGSCCDVAVAVGADGTVRYTLTDPGCCDLRPAIERAEVPAATVQTTEIPVPALFCALPVVPIPLVVPVALNVETPRESAPRAPPPLSSASPRAPPFFS